MMYDWPSGEIMAHMFNIIASEILGYNTVFSFQTTTNRPGIAALSSCNIQADENPEVCINNRTFAAHGSHHVGLEHWDNSLGKTFRVALYGANPDHIAQSLGSIGYSGSEGVHVPRHVLEAGNAMSLALDDYKSYDVSSHNAAQFFDKIQDINSSKLIKCSDRLTSSVLSDGNGLKAYYTHFGQTDPDGVLKATVDDVVSYELPCQHGERWWLSPACRSSPDTCIPYITYKGWYGPALMQVATQYNMPVAIAEASWGDFTDLALHQKVLHYSWNPDDTFLSNDPVLLRLNPHNADEFANNKWITQATEIDLLKVVHNQLATIAPRAHATVQALTISQTDIANILKDTLGNSSSSKYEMAACEYLRNNAGWRTWIPATPSPPPSAL